MPQQPHPVYHRTPFPAQARPPYGWYALCWMLIIFSPFVGFALHGKVAEPGLVAGLWFALLPVGALVLMGRKHRAARRQVPAEVTAEWRHGRLVPPDGAPALAAPLRYANARHWIDLRADGVLMSRNVLLNVHSTGSFSEHLATVMAADAAGQYFVPWSSIECWGVESDSDGPDFYRLALRPQGEVRVRRFRASAGHEADLLDGVRAIGQVPVRLHDDLTAD